MTAPFEDQPVEAAGPPVEAAGPPRTGLPEVDSAIADIAAAADSAPAEQLAAYEAAHQRLQKALTTIEES
jgi:hypothetical protein